MAMHVSPCSPWRTTLEQILTLQPHAGAGGCAMKESAACGGHMLEQIFPEGLQSIERTHARAVCKGLQPVGRTQAGEG